MQTIHSMFCLHLPILISDNPNFILYYLNGDISTYVGWHQQKVCYFGSCALEIPTRAQHPGSPVFYVWVTTITTDPSSDYRLEKATNYQIFATSGLNDCELTSNFITGFCLPTVQTLTHVYKYSNVTARNAEAEARFNNFLCKCTTPLSDCRTKLTRFSCLESFRECDASGFWLPICRNECELVINSCGYWETSDYQCSCTRPEYSCTNPRYSDNSTAFCTGEQIPSVTPSPIPLPSTSPTPSISVSLSPSSSIIPSRTPTNTLTIPYIVDNSSENTIITIYEDNSSSTLLPNTFMFVLVFVCYLLI